MIKEEVQEVQQLELSSRKRRILAFIIDHILFSVVIVSIAFLFLGPDIFESDSDPFVYDMIVLIFSGLFIYLAKDSVHGISPGKWIMGIMVRDYDNPEETPSFWRLFLRNITIIIWPIEFIVLASSQEKMRLGDKFTKALVVANPNKPIMVTRIFALIGVIVISGAIIFQTVISTMKGSGAYHLAIERIEQNDDIIKETGGIVDYGYYPKGNINVRNGYGNANLQITVNGKEKDVLVNVYLNKNPGGEWELHQMETLDTYE